MHKLVLIRHGQSTWNMENRFTGWTDVDLTVVGEAEAASGGLLLAQGGYEFDIVYTSVLKRAIRTMAIVTDVLDQMWVPVIRAWQLNERHYGDLQGLNKAEMTRMHGEAKVLEWRRSYDIPPPPLSPKDPRYPGHDRRYRDLSKEDLPVTESLKETVARVVPYWNTEIAPAIKSGKRVLIVAHGNSLRALVKYLDGISEEAIVKLNIPTGIPLVYELNDDLTPIRNYYLGDPEAAKKAAEAVANQAKAN